MLGKYWFTIIFALVSSACEWAKLNEDYHSPGEADTPAVTPCGPTGKCRAPTSMCKAETMTCVECMKDADCPKAAPVCAQNICAQCDDDRCDSKLCILEGECVSPKEVIYVGGPDATDNPLCSLSAPCQNLDQGLRSSISYRYIKIIGNIINDNGIVFDNKNVSIIGRAAARISRKPPMSPMMGRVFLIRGNNTPHVSLSDVEIVGNVTTGIDRPCVDISETAVVTMTRVNLHDHEQEGILLTDTGRLVLSESEVHDNILDGIKVKGGTLDIRRSLIYRNKGVAGVSATNAGLVTIDSSIIADNIAASGGVLVSDGSISIRNSIISRNTSQRSGPTLNAGGVNVDLGDPNSGHNANLNFNTIANNVSGISETALGLYCAQAINISNSILSGNAFNANCSVVYSLLDENATGSNKIGSPAFLSMNFTDPRFYRIAGTSAARNGADPMTTLNVDIDGEARDDESSDMGADEYRETEVYQGR